MNIQPQTQTDHTDEYAERLLKEQVRLIYQQLPGFIFAPAIGAGLLSVMHWDHTNNKNIIIWCTLIFVFNTLTAIALYYSYKSYSHRKPKPEFWGNAFITLGLISGICWGSSTYFLFTPDNTTLQLILTLYLFSACSLIALALTAYSYPLYTITFPILSSLSIRFYYQDSEFSSIISITSIVFLVSLYFFYYKVHRGFVDSIILWFEKNDMAQQLRIRTKTAEMESTNKSRLLAEVSHDIQQPLITQDLLLEHLITTTKNDEVNKTVSRLITNAKAIRSIFDQLIELSRFDLENIKPNIKPVSLKTIQSSINNLFSEHAKAKNISITTNLNSRCIMTDRHLIERALYNIIANAIKYTDHGHISITDSLENNMVTIKISDTGIGIPHNEIKYIFNEFYRSRNAKTRSDGCGLGLSITKRICDLLEYEINVISETSKGSCFILSIPLNTSPMQAHT